MKTLNLFMCVILLLTVSCQRTMIGDSTPAISTTRPSATPQATQTVAFTPTKPPSTTTVTPMATHSSTPTSSKTPEPTATPQPTPAVVTGPVSGMLVAVATQITATNMLSTGIKVWDIVVIELPSGRQTFLTRDLYYDQHPCWSPDGRQIVFSSDRSGQFEIFVINADGTGLAQLTQGVGNKRHASWSPDGKRIAYSSEYQIQDVNYESIEIIDLDTRQVDTIMTVTESFTPPYMLWSIYDLDWSPMNERLILYLLKGVPHICDIKSQENILLSQSDDWQCSFVRWAPDGRTVLMAGCVSEKIIYDYYIPLLGQVENVEGRFTLTLAPLETLPLVEMGGWSANGSMIVTGYLGSDPNFDGVRIHRLPPSDLIGLDTPVWMKQDANLRYSQVDWHQ